MELENINRDYFCKDHVSAKYQKFTIKVFLFLSSTFAILCFKLSEIDIILTINYTPWWRFKNLRLWQCQKYFLKTMLYIQTFSVFSMKYKSFILFLFLTMIRSWIEGRKLRLRVKHRERPKCRTCCDGSRPSWARDGSYVLQCQDGSRAKCHKTECEWSLDHN